MRRISTLVLLLASSCITRRVDINLVPPQPKPFSAGLVVAFAVGDRGLTAAGGCAVDPVRGVRVELRDPSGATLLLLLLNRNRGQILAVPSGRVYAWTDASREMPWSSADLWFLFTGRPPQGLRDLQATEKGLVYAVWDNGMGTVSCRFNPTPGAPFAYDSAQMKAPGGSEIKVTWHGFQAQEFQDAVFSLPAGMTPIPSSLRDVLGEAAP